MLWKIIGVRSKTFLPSSSFPLLTRRSSLRRVFSSAADALKERKRIAVNFHGVVEPSPALAFEKADNGVEADNFRRVNRKGESNYGRVRGGGGGGGVSSSSGKIVGNPSDDDHSEMMMRGKRRQIFHEDIEGDDSVKVTENSIASAFKIPASYFMGQSNYHETVALLRQTLNYLRSKGVFCVPTENNTGPKFWLPISEMSDAMECKIGPNQYRIITTLLGSLMKYSHVANVAELLSMFSKDGILMKNEVLNSVKLSTVDRIKRGEVKSIICGVGSSSSEQSEESGSVFYEATGSRKTAKATVLLFPHGTGQFLINNQHLHNYFKSDEKSMYEIARPMLVTQTLGSFNGSITVSGGGLSGK